MHGGCIGAPDESCPAKSLLDDWLDSVSVETSLGNRFCRPVDWLRIDSVTGAVAEDSVFLADVKRPAGPSDASGGAVVAEGCAEESRGAVLFPCEDN